MTRSPLLALALIFSLAACGSESTTTTSSGEGAKSLLIAAKPAGAISVLEVKNKAEGDEVVVVGRVQNIVKGFAALTLVDDTVDWCSRGEAQCGCKTPWDYCCEIEAFQAGSMPVEVRDAKGEPIETDDTGLRLLDLVVIKGKLAKNESGGLIIVTNDGWHRAERPTLPSGLKWPQ